MRRIVIILVLAVLASGCGSGGGGDEGGGTATDTENAPAAPTPSPDEGCTPEQPREQAVARDYALLIDVCVAEDGTSLSLKNVSSAVLQVWSLGPSEPTLDVKPPDEKSLAAAATVMAVEGYTADQGVLVAPDARVVASSDESFTLDVAVVEDVSVYAYSAKVLGEWVERRLTTPAQQFAKGILKCAESALAVYKTGSAGTWQEALGDAVARAWSCLSLRRQVYDALNAPPRPPAGVADDVAKVADNVSTAAWDEALKLAGRVIKVAAS